MYHYQASVLLTATLTLVFVGLVDGDSTIDYNQLDKTACYGSTFVMIVQRPPWDVVEKVWFVPRYSRNTIEIYPRNTKPGCQWEFGSFVIEYVTEEDEGEYKLSPWGQNSFHRRPTTVTYLTLTVTECTDTKTVNWGNAVNIRVIVAPAILIFYPANEHNFYPTDDASKGIKLWSSDKSSEGEVCTTDHECDWFVESETDIKWMVPGFITMRGEVWYVRKSRATHKDQGMYVVRQKDGRLINKFQIFVQGTEPTKPDSLWWSLMKPVILIAIAFGFAFLVLCLRATCKCKGSGDAEPPQISNQIEEELMERHPPRIIREQQTCTSSTSYDSVPPSYDQVQCPDICPPSYDQIQCQDSCPPSYDQILRPGSCLPSYEQTQHPAISTGLENEGPSYYTTPSAPSFDEVPRCTMPSAPAFQPEDFLNNQALLNSGAPNREL